MSILREPTAIIGGVLKLHRGATSGEVSLASLPDETVQNRPVDRDGTAPAINYLISGDAAHFVVRHGRGGVRNRADRESTALTTAQVANLIAAERHAFAIGLPFTRMITIHWEAGEVPLEGMARATGRFVDLLSKTLTRHGCRTSWLWVHEGGPDKGGHCHLMVHVPAHLVEIVNKRQRGWLRCITGKPYRKRVIRSRPIGGRLGMESSNPALHAVNLEATVAYMLKGATHEAAAIAGLLRREEGGRVIGKRCATSQNIGAKARKEAVNLGGTSGPCAMPVQTSGDMIDCRNASRPRAR